MGRGGTQDGESLFLPQQPEKLIPTLNSHTHSGFMVQVPASTPTLIPRSQNQQLPWRSTTQAHTHTKKTQPCAQLEKANGFTGKDKYRHVASAYALHAKTCTRGPSISTSQETRSFEHNPGHLHTDTRPTRTKQALIFFSRSKHQEFRRTLMF